MRGDRLKIPPFFFSQVRASCGKPVGELQRRPYWRVWCRQDHDQLKHPRVIAQIEPLSPRPFDDHKMVVVELEIDRERQRIGLWSIYQDPKTIVLLSNLTCCQRQWNGTGRRRESSDSEIDVIPSSRVVVVERRSSSWASPRSILELCCNLSKPRGNRGDKLLRHQFSSFGRRWLRVCWAQFGLLPQKVIGRWTRWIQLQSGR